MVPAPGQCFRQSFQDLVTNRCHPTSAEPAFCGCGRCDKDDMRTRLRKFAHKSPEAQVTFARQQSHLISEGDVNRSSRYRTSFLSFIRGQLADHVELLSKEIGEQYAQ